MRKFNFWSLNFLTMCSLSMFILSCNPADTNNTIIDVDVSKDYPVKTLSLESFSKIEYVVMDDSNDFLFKGRPQCITDNTIVIDDMTSGDFLLFDRQGHPLSKISAKGDGPNQFASYSRIIYDENNRELFVFDENRVFVYSSDGTFIRAFRLPENARIIDAHQFDESTLIVFDDSENYESNFLLLSKQNGEILESIPLPRKKKPQLYIMEEDGNRLNFFMAKRFNIVHHREGFLLTDYSLDTVYLYNRNKDISPFLVRSPQIQEMQPVIYLNSLVESSQYQFLQTVQVENKNNQLPKKCILRERKSNKIFTQEIVLDEFRGKLFEITPDCISKTRNCKVAIFELDLDELQSANLDGKLSGRLKEITDRSIESNNENNIYMFVYIN